jgi:hypothetical protein
MTANSIADAWSGIALKPDIGSDREGVKGFHKRQVSLSN